MKKIIYAFLAMLLSACAVFMAKWIMATYVHAECNTIPCLTNIQGFEVFFLGFIVVGSGINQYFYKYGHNLLKLLIEVLSVFIFVSFIFYQKIFV